VAFLYNNETKKWLIKSFKAEESFNPAFEMALGKHDVIKIGGKHD